MKKWNRCLCWDEVFSWVLGLVFIYAGAIKVARPHDFADAVATFAILPSEGITLVALGLPVMEILLGILILLRPVRRQAAFGILLLCGGFALALVQGMIRGLPLDCGCFGGEALDGSPSFALVRDLILGAAAWRVWKNRGG